MSIKAVDRYDSLELFLHLLDDDNGITMNAAAIAVALCERKQFGPQSECIKHILLNEVDGGEGRVYLPMSFDLARAIKRFNEKQHEED